MNDKPTKAGEYISPAFPSTFHTGWGEPEKGMALRDYFAAKAMQGFLAYASHKGIYTPPNNELASSAYDLADAMISARSTEKAMK